MITDQTEKYSKLVMDSKKSENDMIKRAVEDCASKFGLTNKEFGEQLKKHLENKEQQNEMIEMSNRIERIGTKALDKSSAIKGFVRFQEL